MYFISLGLAILATDPAPNTCSEEDLLELIETRTIERVFKGLCPKLENVERAGYTLPEELAVVGDICLGRSADARALCGIDETQLRTWNGQAAALLERITWAERACEELVSSKQEMVDACDRARGPRPPPSKATLQTFVERKLLSAEPEIDESPRDLGVSSSATSRLIPDGDLIETVATGLANFLVARAQQELQLYVVDKMRALVCTSTVTPNPATLLPNTCAFLGDRNDYFAPSFGPAFVAAVLADVEGLPKTLPKFFGDLLPANEVGLLLRAHLALLSTLYDTQAPKVLVEEFRSAVISAKCAPGETKCEAARAALRTTALLVTIVVDRVPDDKAPSDETIQEIRLLAATVLGRPLTAEDRNHLRAAIAGVQRVRAAFVRLKTQQLDKQARVEIITSLVSDLVNVLNLLVSDEKLEIVDDVVKIARAALAGDHGAVLTRSLGLVRQLAPRGTAKIPSQVVRILALGADLAKVEDADQAEAAIESFAAPVGSWRLKRESFGLYLNGLVGFGAGGEMLTSGQVSGGELSFQASFVGSVGLDASWPVGKSTLGAYVSIVDVGPLASLRTDGEQEAVNPDGQTEDADVTVGGANDPLALLSPGVYFRWGICETPLVLAVGASYVPKARSLRFEGVEDSRGADAVRVMGLLAVDVVIFPLLR